MTTPRKPFFGMNAVTLGLAAAGLLHAPAAWAASCAAGWVEGNTYAANSQASYQGRNYTALQTHTAFVGANWNPAASPTLWRFNENCNSTPTPTPTP
ncbi:carbohydrate-binding protein, partial [Chitinimonas prasina]